MMSIDREPVIPVETNLHLTFAELEQAEIAFVEARRNLQTAAETLSGAQQQVSSELSKYFEGKQVKVTGFMEEETAYSVNDGGYVTVKVWDSVNEQDAVITGAAITRAHYSDILLPRLTMEMKGGPRNGRSVRFRLDQIRGLVMVEETSSS